MIGGNQATVWNLIFLVRLPEGVSLIEVDDRGEMSYKYVKRRRNQTVALRTSQPFHTAYRQPLKHGVDLFR